MEGRPEYPFIDSRYDDPRELDELQNFVEALKNWRLQYTVERVFYDSKSTFARSRSAQRSMIGLSISSMRSLMSTSVSTFAVTWFAMESRWRIGMTQVPLILAGVRVNPRCHEIARSVVKAWGMQLPRTAACVCRRCTRVRTS